MSDLWRCPCCGPVEYTLHYCGMGACVDICPLCTNCNCEPIGDSIFARLMRWIYHKLEGRKP